MYRYFGKTATLIFLFLIHIRWTGKLLLPLEMINRFIFVPFGPPLETIDILPGRGVPISIGADGARVSSKPILHLEPYLKYIVKYN